jgi:predicted membrane channel-forming protein YqfA (hemolysin III family)
MEHERQFTQLAYTVFWGWAIVGVTLGVLVFIVGRRMDPRGAIALTVAAIAFVLVSASAVMNFVALGMSFDGPDRLIEPVRLIGQLLLIGVVLVSVGGVHYQPRPPTGERQDLEVA